jgi:hypothetical protein
LGGTYRVLVEQARCGPGGQLFGSAGAATGHGRVAGKVGDGIGVGGKGLGYGAGQDDQVGRDALGGLADGGDRRVRTQVDDAPAPPVQGDAKGEQPEVVLLARQAGQDGGGTVALAQPRASPSRRPRSRLEATCSWATETSPPAQRSPRSWR